MARALLIVGIWWPMLLLRVYLKKERKIGNLAVHNTEAATRQGQ